MGLYTQLDSIDLWESNIVNNTLSQVEYFAAAGKFQRREDAFAICEKLLEMLFSDVL